jgi:methylmalonyl-CoA/ethylmalonyl-CoA epimerase
VIPAAEFGLSTLAQIGLSVSNLERAVKFYRDVLGLRLLFEVPNMAFFDCAGIRLMLGLPHADLRPSGSILYFKVANIDRATEELKSRGLEFKEKPHLVARMPDHELWMAFFDDPDGNLLALMCEKR